MLSEPAPSSRSIWNRQGDFLYQKPPCVGVGSRGRYFLMLWATIASTRAAASSVRLAAASTRDAAVSDRLAAASARLAAESAR